MSCNQIFDLLISRTAPETKNGIPDFVPADCPHQKIGRAYDKAAKMYDSYILGGNVFLKTLKKIALGLGDEVETEYSKKTKAMLSQVKRGAILDIPAGTGLLTFEEYAKYPDILFVAAEYSWGMLKQAQQKIKKLGAKNILLIRADVGHLPFKAESFDAVLCLSGIHSFPEKEKAVSEMSRVLKPGKKLHGLLVLKGERWLTDLMLEYAYYHLLWFTRPALTRREFFHLLEKYGLAQVETRFMKSALLFEAEKKSS